MKWRIISAATHTAVMNMAIDQAIYESVNEGKSPPTIRFYQWKSGGISIGKGQNAEIVNIKNCSKDGIGVVRRPTGGNALFHHPIDFTYAVIAPNSAFSTNKKGQGMVNLNAYREICSWIVKALRKAGIQSHLHGSNNVMVGNKKISGNAQYNGGKTFLQHGSIFISTNTQLWGKYLNVPAGALKDIIGIQSLIKVKASLLYGELIDAFTSNPVVNGCFTEGRLSPQELKSAEKLSKSMFGKEHFLGSRSEKLGSICAIDALQ